MTEVVAFDGFSLRPQGPTLSLSLLRGQIMGIVGPSGGGKTHFLRTLLGSGKPAQGTVRATGAISVAGLDRVSRRTTPDALARRYAGRNSDLAAAALHDLRLWDVREQPIVDLPSGQVAAAELLAVLVADCNLGIVDGQLDRLDPWTFERVTLAMRRRSDAGMAYLVATHRTDIDPLIDLVAVLVNQEVKFAGDVPTLLRRAAPSEVTVVSKNQPGVRALVEPFKISVRATEEGFVFQAHEGQPMVARLLLEGYGDIEFVTLREPTFATAVLDYDDLRITR